MDLIMLASLTYTALRALPRYQSSYKGTQCACCKGEVAVGESIVQICPKMPALGRKRREEDLPPWLRLFRALGLVDTIVFRYVHTRCLPPELSAEAFTVVRTAAAQLWSNTDPAWPLDFKGFNKSDAGPMQRWIDTGFHPMLGASMAKRLLKYVDTQLGSELGDQLRSIVATIEAQPVQVALPVAPRPAQAVEPRPAPPRKSVLIDVQGNVVMITLDKPWCNPEHAAVKDRLKAARATFTPGPNVWTMGVQRFAAILPRLLGDVPATITDAAERALILAAR